MSEYVEPITQDEMEGLAAAAHAIWSDWVHDLHRVASVAENLDLVIPASVAVPWTMAATMNYRSLSEREKVRAQNAARELAGVGTNTEIASALDLMRMARRRSG